MEPDYSELLNFAIDVVRDAGTRARDFIGKASLISRKAFGEPYTEGDRLINGFVAARIQQAYPGHGFLSEEDVSQAYDRDYLWILDPIDGTKYYMSNVPLYSVSLALQVKNQLVLGAVNMPAFGQLFAGSLGRGATLNGTHIHCSKQHSLNEAVICAEIPNIFGPEEERAWALDKFQQLVNRTYRTRILGVASLGLCWCAMGAFDGYVNLGRSTKIWDMAAGQVILTEAGGKFSIIGGRMAGGSPALQDQLVALIDTKD